MAFSSTAPTVLYRKAELSSKVILNNLKSWFMSYSVDPKPYESRTITLII